MDICNASIVIVKNNIVVVGSKIFQDLDVDSITLAGSSVVVIEIGILHHHVVIVVEIIIAFEENTGPVEIEKSTLIDGDSLKTTRILPRAINSGAGVIPEGQIGNDQVSDWGTFGIDIDSVLGRVSAIKNYFTSMPGIDTPGNGNASCTGWNSESSCVGLRGIPSRNIDRSAWLDDTPVHLIQPAPCRVP